MGAGGEVGGVMEQGVDHVVERPPATPIEGTGPHRPVGVDRSFQYTPALRRDRDQIIRDQFLGWTAALLA